MEELFQSIGLSESKARDTLKNANVSNALKSYILQVRTDAVDTHVFSQMYIGVLKVKCSCH